MNELHIQDVPVGNLRQSDNNPRIITEQRFLDLLESLKADPDMLRVRPLVALPDGRVIMGNQRLRAAKELGWKTVPTVYADLDEQRAQEWMLRDNNEFGDWDLTQVGAMLKDLEKAGRSLNVLGFNEQEIQASLAAVQAAHDGAGATSEDVDPIDVPETAISQVGDQWTMGNHRLVVGDCTDPEMLGWLMEGEKAHVVWTDPPYRVGYVGKTKDALTIVGDTIDGQVAETLLIPAFTAAMPHIRPGSPFYVACPPGDVQTDFRMALRAVGWRLHEGLVWVKDVMVLGHSDYHLQHEDILYGWLPGPGRSGRGDHKGSRWYGDNSQTSTFAIARPTRSTAHPNMKPPALIAEHLKNSSRRGDTVLDLFAGSGSTMIAAEQLGRHAYMLELDCRYADVLLQRFLDMTGESPVREDGVKWTELHDQVEPLRASA